MQVPKGKRGANRKQSAPLAEPNEVCYVRESTDHRAAVVGVSQKYFRPSLDRGCTCRKPKAVVVPVVLLYRT